MKQGEYFKINSIEELKKAYYIFELKWCYSLEDEIEYFNKGFRYVLCSISGIYLGNDVLILNNTEINNPVRNINNLNKLI